ncbi:hypothetical protein CANTEDRAFT_127905 [Yamadazyma tenuis ATCC 10573]|nr:uncharacterized protein CANTEDRAFT_127905 [Yamadazyma tenuis ATCC 10573]EGV60556.1 hypothetical protein CANTEDRAFT_127905 [Yamadazyma tenuis ATCC 10573]
MKRAEDSAVDSGSSHSSSKDDLTDKVYTAGSPRLKQLSDDVFLQSDDDDHSKTIGHINRYLHTDQIQSQGGDITRDIYKLVDNKTQRPGRTRSLSSTELETSRRGSMASSINTPGGFRREFILNKKNSANTRQASLFTRNFVEFLSIYGHFAGEDLESDDDIACHYEPNLPRKYRGVDEEAPLLSHEDDGVSYSLINPKGTATDTKAYFLLVKAFVGTGVLFLPRGFSNGGLVFSIVTLMFFGVLSYWCYLILVHSKQATRLPSFGDMGLKLYGEWLQQLIFTSIVISQVGFIATYIVFTSQNIQAFLRNAIGLDNLDIKWFILGQLFVLIPLSLVRDITKLSLVAVLANFLILFGLVTIIYFILIDLFIENSGAVGDGIQFLFNKKEFSMFIGIAIFAFEGIGLIIPIQESMIYPNHFPKVLFQVILTISVIMIGVGTLGYVTYGQHIETVILLNLPQDSVFVISIQLLYSLAILLSTPLQIFPAIRLIESKLFVRTGKNSLTIKWLKNLFRASFVIGTAIIALYGGKNLDKFVSFVGCFACIPLVYMYPPMLHLRSCCVIGEGLSPAEIRRRIVLAYSNYGLLVIGACALSYTTYDILAS